MTERSLPPETYTESPDVEGAPLSENAQKAMAQAEQRAAEKRAELLAQDQELKARANAGPSETSSGMRVAPPKSRAKRSQAIKVPTPNGGATVVHATGGVALAPASSVDEESRVQAATAAFTMMEEMRQKEADRRADEKKDVMWYVRCHVCGGPGIWLYKKESDMRPEHWAASYKPLGVMWPSKTIWCQCCLEHSKREVPLKILHTTDGNGNVRMIRPYPRMIEEISVKEYNRLMGVEEESTSPEEASQPEADGATTVA